MSRIAFLFPGQGAQTVGMGRRLAESLPAARQLYDRAAQVLGYDLAKLCFEGPADMLDSTIYSQPALFVTSLAALESLRAESPEVVLACEAAAGLSLGEYTAMVFAGVMDFEDGSMLVQSAGRPCRKPPTPRPAAWSASSAWSECRSRPSAAGPQRRGPANRQPSLPGQHCCFRDQCGL